MEPYDDSTKLIRALFAATRINANDAWLEFLATLREITRAEGASLTLNHQSQTRKWSDGCLHDPDSASGQALRFNRVYSQESLPEFRGVSAPIRIIKVRILNGAGLTLSINRKAHSQDFRGADGQMLSGLVPFLGRAMDLWLEQQRERAECAIEHTLLAALGGSWVIFDMAGRVLTCPPALIGLHSQAGFEVTEGMPLNFLEQAFASEFKQAFSRASTGKTPFVSSLKQGEILLCQFEHDNARAILGQLRLTPQCKSISSQAIAEHFGISCSEARLAQLICDGYSLKVAAARLGWTEESARTCSKSLFARLDVSGQPGLVRRILNSSVWFAEPKRSTIERHAQNLSREN